MYSLTLGPQVFGHLTTPRQQTHHLYFLRRSYILFVFPSDINFFLFFQWVNLGYKMEADVFLDLSA